eukprot:gene24035-32446_t
MPLWRFLLWKGMMLGVEYSSRLEPLLCIPLRGHRFRLLSAATSLLDFRQNRCMLLSHFDEPHDDAADATNVELSVEFGIHFFDSRVFGSAQYALCRNQKEICLGGA